MSEAARESRANEQPAGRRGQTRTGHTIADHAAAGAAAAAAAAPGLPGLPSKHLLPGPVWRCGRKFFFSSKYKKKPRGDNLDKKQG